MNTRPSFLLTAAALLIGAFLPFADANAGNPFAKSVEKLDLRIRRSAERFEAMQAEPAKRIPAALLSRARGIIILHKVKAGLGIGGEAGNGVALVKDPQTGSWSAPAFISSAEGSWGLQIGAQEATIIMLLMNDAGLKPLVGGSMNIGVDIAAAVGPNDGGGDIDTTTIQSPILVYTNAGGLFAGAAFKGGGIVPANKNNELYYRQTMKQIIFDRTARPTASGMALIQTILNHSGHGGY